MQIVSLRDNLNEMSNPEQLYHFCTSIWGLLFTVNPLCQSLFKLSGLHGAWESAHYRVVEPGVSNKQTSSNTQEVLWETSWCGQSLQCGSFQNCFWCFYQWRTISRLPKSQMLLQIFPSFRPMGMVGEACCNAYYPRTPDYTLYSGVQVCWSEHSDSSFIYRFMSLDYG